MKQSRTTTLTASSRAAVNIRGTFYTFEASEEIDVRNVKEHQLQEEKDLLWNRVHSEVDKQIREVVEGGN